MTFDKLFIANVKMSNKYLIKKTWEQSEQTVNNIIIYNNNLKPTQNEIYCPKKQKEQVILYLIT